VASLRAPSTVGRDASAHGAPTSRSLLSDGPDCRVPSRVPSSGAYVFHSALTVPTWGEIDSPIP
jgi:hypothetical protein